MNLSFNFLGTSESGELSAYKNRFTGFYVPRGMFGSPDAYYYSSDHEAYETLATYKTNLTANLDSTTIQESQYRLQISGDLFGGQSGVVETSIPLVTGSVSSGLNDLPTYYIRVTGEFKANGDEPTLKNIIKGTFDTSNRFDSSTFLTSITGDLSSGLNELSTIINVVSGDVYRFEKESATVGVLMSGISFVRGHVRERAPITGEFTLGVSISNIFFSRAGG